MLIKVELIISSYENYVISLITYHVSNYDFFIKRNSGITLPKYEYLK